MNRFISVFSTSLLSFSLFAFGPGSTAALAAPKTAAKSAKPAQDTPPASTEVLATWRNLTLDKLDYEASIRSNVPKEQRPAFARDMRRITSILDDIQVRRTLADDARQAGLDKDPVVARQMALAAERVLSQLQLDRWEAGLKVPDLTPAAEEQYKLKPEAHRMAEQAHASHVLIGLDKRSDEEARARAEEVLAKARAGADFAELVKDYSEDPSASKNSGDLGWFTRDRMVKPFADAAFALEKGGDLSGPVKSPFGYHVIKLHEKKDAQQRTFAEVKDKLVDELQKKWIGDQKTSYLSEIRNNKSIRLNAPGIDSLLAK